MIILKKFFDNFKLKEQSTVLDITNIGDIKIIFSSINAIFML